MKYLITLIIPTFNRPNDLQKCLISVVNSTRKPDEVIIVDDAGRYDLTDIVKEILEDKIEYKIIINAKNVGHSTSRNIGIKNSKGDLIFFLDDDCEVLPDYFLEIEKIYLNDDEGKIGGVEGIILDDNNNSNNKKNQFFEKFFMLTHYSDKSDMQLSGFETRSIIYDKIIRVNILMGAASFRKSIYNEFQYNNDFPGWSWDDMEFSYRVSKKYELVRTPFAKMYHHHTSVSRESQFQRQSKMIWMHFITWNTCIKTKFLSIAAFIWSDIGYSIKTIWDYNFKFQVILGLFSGHIDLLKIMIKKLLKLTKIKNENNNS